MTFADDDDQPIPECLPTLAVFRLVAEEGRYSNVTVELRTVHMHVPLYCSSAKLLLYYYFTLLFGPGDPIKIWFLLGP